MAKSLGIFLSFMTVGLGVNMMSGLFAPYQTSLIRNCIKRGIQRLSFLDEICFVHCQCLFHNVNPRITFNDITLDGIRP